MIGFCDLVRVGIEPVSKKSAAKNTQFQVNLLMPELMYIYCVWIDFLGVAARNEKQHIAAQQ